MAVMLNGMTARETKDLTMAMVKSGEQLDFSSISSFVVDKHSTGGVGDKTTLAVAPMVAACGLPVGKMSGRGLGFSGGTIDKLESIPGFRANLTVKEFFNQLKEIGLVVSGQSVDLAPADGKLYALRDVTGTVPSLPLIASSIMSKKLAAGAHAIVLDVKTGLGAFMQTLEEAKQLARLMVEIAHLAEKEAIAVISDMNQPLGYAVGNALELIEAIDTLHGKGPRDFVEHCLVIAGYMLYLAKKVNNLEEGKRLALKTIEDGSAWKKFREMVSAQGGDVTTVDDVTKLPKARLIEKVAAQASGYILGIHAAQVARQQYY
jgi:pyrimidine-nucleoside phosphorylase